MADRRKLQGEIDRCLKKVTEGVEIFDDIWQKVHGATNANQKEKYEADLKKEIKKLQRLRDQIKTWTSSSDIKDKRVLQENRKLIETQMERFKVVERETKTKAYSKEGLSGAIQKTDPAQKEREEMRQWVTASIGTLNLQIEQFESEIETLILTSKKKKLEKDKQDRVDQVRKYMEKHKYHVKQLETLLRMLDNNNIETESIRNIKDDIEYYIECSQDPDFKENEYIYEDLNLDEANDDSLTNSSPPSTTCSSPTPSSPHTVQNFSKSFSQEDDCKVKGHKGRTDEESGHSHVIASLSDDATHSSYPTADHVTVVTNLTATAHKPIPHSRLPHPHADSPATRRQSADNQLFSASSSLPTGPPIPYAAIAGHVTSSMSVANSSTFLHQHQSAFQSSFAPLVGDGVSMPNRVQNLMEMVNHGPPQSSLSGSIAAADSLKSIASQIVMASNLNSPPPDTNQPDTFGPKRTATEDLIQEQQSRRLCILKRLLRDHQQQQPPHQESVSGSLEISSYIDNLKDILLASAATSGPAPPSHVTTTTTPGLDVGGVPVEVTPPVQAPPVTDNKKFIEEVLSRMVVGGHHGVEQALRAGPPPDHRGFPHPPQGYALGGLRGEAVVTPLLAASPLGPIHLGPQEAYRASLVDRVYNSETALPKAMDSEKTRWLLNRTPYATPTYYHNPSCSIDNSDFYQRLSTETLFFVFYYFEGSKAQYMAAKALKKLSWRFHTKYLMWFQRHEEPKTITDEYEQGTYIYFDYEKWSQRRKEGFTFEYKFLEDRDLS